MLQLIPLYWILLASCCGWKSQTILATIAMWSMWCGVDSRSFGWLSSTTLPSVSNSTSWWYSSHLIRWCMYSRLAYCQLSSHAQRSPLNSLPHRCFCLCARAASSSYMLACWCIHSPTSKHSCQVHWLCIRRVWSSMSPSASFAVFGEYQSSLLQLEDNCRRMKLQASNHKSQTHSHTHISHISHKLTFHNSHRLSHLFLL